MPVPFGARRRAGRRQEGCVPEGMRGGRRGNVPRPSRGAAFASAGGFTLLELLVVMVIIGLLASYVGPKYFSQVGKSESRIAAAQCGALEKALDQYRLDTGRYPTSEQGLQALVMKPADEPKWTGPYLSKAVPADPWGKPYLYRCCPGEHGEFDLYTLGKDGSPGGSGADADVTSWTPSQ